MKLEVGTKLVVGTNLEIETKLEVGTMLKVETKFFSACYTILLVTNYYNRSLVSKISIFEKDEMLLALSLLYNHRDPQGRRVWHIASSSVRHFPYQSARHLAFSSYRQARHSSQRE